MKNLPLLTILFIALTTNAQSFNEQFNTLSTASPAESYQLLQKLQHEPKNAFNPEAKSKLQHLLTKNTPHLDLVIMLTGYVELQQAIPQLKIIADSSDYSPRDRWAAYLALARMNDQQAISFINDKIRSAAVDDDFIYDVVPDLIYTRNHSIYDYLITLLMDERSLCSSANPDNEAAISCGYRLMEYFAPVIKNYPLKITASGDVDTDDYPRALQKVRDWFSKNKSNYEIDRDRF